MTLLCLCARSLALLVFFSGIAVSPSLGRAEVRAVLVGVSDYDNSIGLKDLKGPANDVRLLQQVLIGRGAEDLVILADGVAGGQIPTRANILQALADMADRAKDGDLVYVHLSGHGTRQPDPQGDETDGLDEVFLPSDTARALPGTNAVTNALVDDDIGLAVRAIRRTGADVWLVMDSCYSGTGLRGSRLRMASRIVEPATLGVDITPSHLEEPLLIEPAGPEPKGRFLAFYSARSSEIANEVAFASATGDEWYGLFTAKLAIRLAAPNGQTYRQLFQAVQSDMNDTILPGGARMQTPGWEGGLIDTTVFGNTGPQIQPRFALRGDEVLAGLVHGLQDGTVLGLVADAADPADAVLGFAQMEETSATKAYLRPVAENCIPHVATLCPYSGSLPIAAKFAQILARPVDQTLRLGTPVDLATDAPLATGNPAFAALHDAVVQLGKDGPWNATLDESDFSVQTYWDGEKLWFGPRAKIGTYAVGLSVVPDIAALTTALTRIARAENLARLLASAAREDDFLNPNPVDIMANLTRSRVKDLTVPGSPVTPGKECQLAKSNVQGQAAPLPASADLKQCDLLAFQAIGTEDGARDVNRIHIDANFCVYAAHETIEGRSQPRKLGPSMTTCSDCPDGYSAGYERLFVIVSEQRLTAEPLNLVGLVETCGPASNPTRGRARSQAATFLNQLARPRAIRRGIGGDSDVWITRYDWRILPKPEAFERAGRK